MLPRQHERVAINTDAILYFPDKKDFICQAVDVSLGGIKVTKQDQKDLFCYIGNTCIIELAIDIPFGIENKRFHLQTKACVVNGDLKGIGLKFEGVDQETMTLLEKLMVSQLQEGDLQTLKDKMGVKVRTSQIKILKTQLEDYIIESVKDVFIAFLAIDVVPGPYVERPEFDEYKPPETEVTGIVLFNGALEGGVHLSSPLHFAIKSAGAMLGEAGLELATQQDDMVWDALGEITNQVAGGIQTRISNNMEGINLTAPNVIIGSNFRINYNKHLSSVRKFFSSPFGPFFIECFFS
ncbi:MAG: chemotaxis protein CheX [Magnetococcus sp. YQC-5]